MPHYSLSGRRTSPPQSAQTKVHISDFTYFRPQSSHYDLRCQMPINGQIPSESFQQITGSVNSQEEQGDADEPKSYRRQRFTKTLTPPGEVKTHHQMTYTRKKTHICKQCDKRFSQLSHLRIHLRIHTGEKPFHCQQCDKAFSQLCDLRRHQRIHSGEKPFRCRQCDRGFSQLVTLRVHQRSHTGERPFRCKDCDKSFRKLYALKRHLLIHTGGKNVSL